MVPFRWDCEHLLEAQAREIILHHVPYWNGYYIVHTPKGEVQFHKDKQGLPYINLEKSNMAAAMMLLQQMERACQVREGALGTEVSLVQMVQGNYKGFM